ncbi:MAG: glycosyltransferase family 2 protein [Desulfatitalea sp.]|nr:glycosyltransferase family 2 protein [Desulfatitalea sp.]NNK01100.1 glycosyltransferase family 2 protein [Desulfatitalea sp.]
MIPVIIPFYKHRHQLDKCLAHLKRQTMPVETFIRDNTHDNIYFTAAINEGIRHFLPSPAHYLILLNQDMYLEPTAVTEMVNFMNRNPGCGIGAPVQLHPRRPDYAIWAGGFDAFPMGKHLHGPLDRFRNDAPLHWANGACMILRKQMVQEIGLLDKNLIFIGSDSDYSFSARARGWSIWRIGAAHGVHDHGASGNSGNPIIEMIKARDMLYFSKKWLTGELYRKMALEGDRLTPERVKTMVDELTRTKQMIAESVKQNALP